MTELLRFLYTDSNLPLQSMPSKISWLDEGAIFVTYIEIHSEKKRQRNLIFDNKRLHMESFLLVLLIDRCHH